MSMKSDQAEPLWSPAPETIAAANMTRFLSRISQHHGLDLNDYRGLHDWSVAHKETFWSEIWEFCGVIGEKGQRILIDGEDMERARWFPDASLNYAENLLRRRDDEVAIVFRAEDQAEYSLTHAALHDQVSSVAAWLKLHGLQPGDRVAGYLPNMPEAVVAMLATASIGAVWTSTSPDFGVESVVDRFGQTTPRFLFAADGYVYNGTRHPLGDKLTAIRAGLPSLEQVVQIPLLGLDCPRDRVDWREILGSPGGTLRFEPRGFNDPLFVLYSSGTTGRPKCITHGVGGTLLQHLKEHMLHCDLKAGDRVFYFTTLGWMMWNWLVSALASGSSLVLYDGSPFHPDGEVLWRYAEDVGMTFFGTSAKYLDSMGNAELRPGQKLDLSRLRTIASTGSVLAPETFDYVYQHVKADVCLASISGGTDIVSCFVLGCPLLPVYRGEIQCPGLGMAVEVFDEAGRPVRNQKGELVCTATFPSQPIYFWGDPDGQKYHDAYFARFDNVWHHGDYVMLTDHDGIVIYGRSDATLNPGGVRIGTAEIYRHVEQLPEVLESLVIGQDWQDDVRVVLFVMLNDALVLDEALAARIRRTIRERCTPRHVPARIIQVAEIPRTKSGKIVELAVREVVHGRPVQNLHSLANPDVLELYRDLPELQE
jgi:acetoacetyl-CoA synthetase